MGAGVSLEAIEGGLPWRSRVFVTLTGRGRGDRPAISMAEVHGTGRGESSLRLKGQAARWQAGQSSAVAFDYDLAVAEKLMDYEFELGVMFGYMLIATEELFGRFVFINDHPALPDGPIGTYQEVIAELMRTQALDSGCMMNVVTGNVDRGPALSFCRFPIRDEMNEAVWEALSGSAIDAATMHEVMAMPLYADIRARGVARERPFLVETLRAIAAGELELPPQTPLDLTDEVEQAVGSTSRV